MEMNESKFADAATVFAIYLYNKKIGTWEGYENLIKLCSFTFVNTRERLKFDAAIRNTEWFTFATDDDPNWYRITLNSYGVECFEQFGGYNDEYLKSDVLKKHNKEVKRLQRDKKVITKKASIKQDVVFWLPNINTGTTIILTILTIVLSTFSIIDRGTLNSLKQEQTNLTNQRDSLQKAIEQLRQKSDTLGSKHN
jgi:FtsZ-binding cell division protein ZapB